MIFSFVVGAVSSIPDYYFFFAASFRGTFNGSFFVTGFSSFTSTPFGSGLAGFMAHSFILFQILSTFFSILSSKVIIASNLSSRWTASFSGGNDPFPKQVGHQSFGFHSGAVHVGHELKLGSVIIPPKREGILTPSR
jgi:hypothetical protein